MSNFFSSTDALDALCMVMIVFLTALAGLMLYSGNTANLTMLLSLDGFFVTLLTGKQIPTANSASLLKVALGKPIAVLQPQNQPRVMSGCGVDDQVLPKSCKTCDVVSAGHAVVKE